VGKSLAGAAAGTADPNWAKWCSVACNGMFRNETGVGAYPKTAWGLAGHQSTSSE